MDAPNQVLVTTPAADPNHPNHGTFLAQLLAGIAQVTAPLWLGFVPSSAQGAVAEGLKEAPVVIQIIGAATQSAPAPATPPANLTINKF